MDLLAYLMAFWVLGFVAGCIAGSGWRKRRCSDLFHRWQVFRAKAGAGEDVTAQEDEELRRLFVEHGLTPRARGGDALLLQSTFDIDDADAAKIFRGGRGGSKN
jgi:hypothetical protein